MNHKSFGIESSSRAALKIHTLSRSSGVLPKGITDAVIMSSANRREPALCEHHHAQGGYHHVLLWGAVLWVYVPSRACCPP